MTHPVNKEYRENTVEWFSAWMLYFALEGKDNRQQFQLSDEGVC